MNKILFGLLLTLGLASKYSLKGMLGWEGRFITAQSQQARRRPPLGGRKKGTPPRKIGTDSPQAQKTNSPAPRQAGLSDAPVKNSSLSKTKIGGTPIPLPPVPSNSDPEKKTRAARSTESVGAGTTPQRNPTNSPRTPSPVDSPELITEFTPLPVTTIPQIAARSIIAPLTPEEERQLMSKAEEERNAAAQTVQRTSSSQPVPTSEPVVPITTTPAVSVPETDPRIREAIWEMLQKKDATQEEKKLEATSSEIAIGNYLENCKVTKTKAAAETEYINLNNLLNQLHLKAQQASRLERWLWILGGKAPREQQYLEWAQEIVQKLNLSKEIRQHKELPGILAKAYCMKPQDITAPYDALRITKTEVLSAITLAATTYGTASLLRQPLYRGKLAGLTRSLGRFSLIQKAGNLASRCLQLFSFKNLAAQQLVVQPTRSAIAPSRTALLRVKSR